MIMIFKLTILYILLCIHRWSTIARYLPGRTDNEIKNYWRTHFKKKGKPSHNEKKQKYEPQFSYNQDQYNVQESMNNSTSSDQSEVHNYTGMMIEPPHATLQETTADLTWHGSQQQQNPCVMAQDVARWWDTVAEDNLWSGTFMLNPDHDHQNYQDAVMEQSFSPCF